MPRKVLAAGLLSSVSARLYNVPSGFEAEAYVSYSNNDTGNATTCNCNIDASDFASFRRIGKASALPASGTIEIPGDSSPICLGPGDEIWGDSAGDVAYIITGKVIKI